MSHLIAVPASEQGLRRAIGEAHRRYTRRINFREKWRGYLWQGRFASFVMDEPYLLAAARYVELNPVRCATGRTARPSGLGAVHGRICRGATTCLVKVGPLLAMVGDWKGLLDSALREEELEELRGHGRTGRPLGDAAFLERLEGIVGRVLKPQKAGRKPKLRRLTEISNVSPDFGLAGDGWRLEGIARQCFAGRGTGRVAWARPNRASAGGRDVSGTFGGHGRPCPEAPEGRSEAQTVRQTTEKSNVSPDFRDTQSSALQPELAAPKNHRRTWLLAWLGLESVD